MKSEAMYRFIHIADTFVDLSIKSFPFGPIRIAPAPGIDGEGTKSSRPDLSFNSRTHYKGSNTYSQFTKFDIGAFSSDRIINSRSKTHTTTDTFTMNAADDEFGTGTHRIDDMCKAAEKCQPLFFIADSNQFIE